MNFKWFRIIICVLVLVSTAVAQQEGKQEQEKETAEPETQRQVRCTQWRVCIYELRPSRVSLALQTYELRLTSACNTVNSASCV